LRDESCRPTIQNRSYNYNIAPAPPIYGGYGGGYGYGYGGGGITLFPTFVTPIGGGGGLFQLLFFAVRTFLYLQMSLSCQLHLHLPL